VTNKIKYGAVAIMYLKEQTDYYALIGCPKYILNVKKKIKYKLSLAKEFPKLHPAFEEMKDDN